MSLHVRFFGLLVCLCTCLSLECAAQAAYLALRLPSGPDTLLAAKGNDGLREVHYKVVNAIPYGATGWSWFGENGTAVDTLRSWRPAVANRIIPGYSKLVLPDTSNTTASALFMDSMGVPGHLPGVGADTWLHFRITSASKPSAPVNEWMSVCTTNFELANVRKWQLPDTIAPGSNAFVRVWFDRPLSPGEWAGVEFDTLPSMRTAQRMVLTTQDSLCTGLLPCFDAGKRVWVRLFTSQLAMRTLDSLFKAFGPMASRLMSLTETGALTDSFYVKQSVGMFGDYLVPGSCFSRLEAFIDTLNRRGMAGALTCHVKTGHREKLNAAAGLQLKVPGHAAHMLRFTSYGTGRMPMLIAGVGNRSMNGSSTKVDGIWSVHGTNNLAIEGFELVDSNAAGSGSARMEYGLALFKDSMNGGCRNVRISRCHIRFMALMSSAGPASFEDGNKGIALINARAEALNQAFAVAGSRDLHANIFLEEDTITTAFAGILVKGMSDNTPPYKRLDSAIAIRKCAIWNFGEEGIKVMNVQDARVVDNHIHTHPQGNLPLTAPVSERFGIVFTSGHLYSEAGIRISGNRITLGGRALSGSQHLFGIALRQNAGTGNRMEVTGNIVRACTNQMQGSTFFGIRNTGQRHTLIIDSNVVCSNRFSATGSHVIAISNTAQIHHALFIRKNIMSRDTISGDYSGIVHNGLARFVIAAGNSLDSVAARGRAIGIQLHSTGLNIRMDSNRVASLRAGNGLTGVSIRNLSTSGTSTCMIRANSFIGLMADSAGSVSGIDLNNGNRHQAELHANRIAGLLGNASVTGITVRSRELHASNNRLAVLDGLPGSQALVAGIELFPGIASLHHNTVYLQGSHADSNQSTAALRWNDSAGSRLLLLNNMLYIHGSGNWRRPVAFLKSRSGLDTNRLVAASSGNYIHAGGFNGPSWLYFNQTDNSGDSQLCEWSSRLANNNLSNLVSGGGGPMLLDESIQDETFLKRRTGNFWPHLILPSSTHDAIGRSRGNPAMQVPGALIDTFSFDLERQLEFSARPNAQALFAPSGQTELASWAVQHKGRTYPIAIRKLAFSIDSTLLVDSLCLWVSVHPDSAFIRAGTGNPARILPVFADSVPMYCGDRLYFKLTGLWSCNPDRKDSVLVNPLYLITDTDSLTAGGRYGVWRSTPRNKPALAINGKDTICPGGIGVWTRFGGQLEPAGQWIWLDADTDTTLGRGDSLRLQLHAGKRLLLRGAGYCDTTAGRSLSAMVYTLPLPANRIRADRDTLCLGVSHWFYPAGGSKGSGGVWSWYAGASADTFLHAGDALQFSLRRPDTLFLRSETQCAKSDWVKLPLAVRDVRRFDWIGNRSDAWHQVDNWCDQVPGIDDTVRIIGKHTFMPRISEAAVAGSLVLDSGARLVLDSGVRLSIHGSLHAPAATLVGRGAALVHAGTDTAEWELPAQLDTDTLIIAGTALRLKGKSRIKQLVLEQGILISNPDTVVLESPAIEGKSNERFAKSWIYGPIVQRVGLDSSMHIPTGDLYYAMPVSLRFHHPGKLSALSVHYRDRPGNDSGLSASEFGIGFNFMAGTGVWLINADPDTSRVLYDLQLWFAGQPDFEHYLQDGSFTILRRHDSSRNAADWALPGGSLWPGKDSAGTRVSDGYARRLGITGFSQFGVAGAAAVLPIGIQDFTLNCLSETEVLLAWHLAPESGVTHVVVEQLVAGQWHAVGRLPAHRESLRSDYQFRITGLKPGRHFFRVQAFSASFHLHTSPLRFCDIAGVPALKAYPNPFGDRLWVVMPSDLASHPVSVLITDLQGRPVYRFHGPADQVFVIDTRNFVSGWYTLTVQSMGGVEPLCIPIFRVSGH